MHQKQLLLLSPHYDDAVLSCAQYALEKQRTGCRVTVLTFFTRFVPPLSQDAKNYMHNSGFSRAALLEAGRRKEDRRAMKILGFSAHSFSFVDGGFRRTQGVPHYTTYARLFSEKLSPLDRAVQKQVTRRLAHFLRKRHFDEIIAPFGVGGHADHVLVKSAALETISDRSRLRFYCDFPYAQLVRHWNWRLIRALITGRPAVRKMSQRKQQAIAAYTSQVPLLFPRPTSYSEIIMRAVS